MPRSTILGVSFYIASATETVAASSGGGLVVIPSAPVLVRMTEDDAHREALLNADIAITDSGLMVLLWRLFTGKKLERVSGLEYLKLLLDVLRTSSSSMRASASERVLWIMPTAAARNRNLAWLQAAGHLTIFDDCYVAPRYPSTGPIVDRQLLEWVQVRRPGHIIIALGGGVQERLGWFLKQEMCRGVYSGLQSSPPQPSIHCVGAAIGFLTGDQVRIPMWADYLYLGWLFRCWSAPRLYVPRYWKALQLVRLMWRYREQAPKRPVLR